MNLVAGGGNCDGGRLDAKVGHLEVGVGNGAEAVASLTGSPGE